MRVSAGDPAALAPILRREVSRLRPDFRVTNAFRQQDLVDQWTIRERLLAKLSVFFAGLALILAGIGLYGVLSYSVVRRTREIGIRMALGAGAWHVTGRVTRQVLGVFAAGTLAGIAAGLASQRFVASLLFAVRATDPPMIAVPFTFLLATALVAALPAAISAVRIDPARALRAE